MNIPEHLNDIYAAGFRDNWSLPAITDYTTGKTFTYGALSYEIARIHMTFELSGLKRGDKVALIGKKFSRLDSRVHGYRDLRGNDCANFAGVQSYRCPAYNKSFRECDAICR